MNTDDIKKAILYRWMYSLFISKDNPDKTFSDKKAIDILNMAGFNVPYNKSVKPFLNEITSTFRQAMKDKKTYQLLERYPMPKIIGLEEEEIPELEESFKGLSVKEETKMQIDEPTPKELEGSIETIIRNSNLEELTPKMVIKQLEGIYGIELTERKQEIKQIINKIIEELNKEESSSSSSEEEIIVPKKQTKQTKKVKKVEAMPDAHYARRGELRDMYKKLVNKIENIRSDIVIDKDLVNDMHGNADQKVLDRINRNKAQIENLKKELNKVEDELYSIPVPTTLEGRFGTIEEGLFQMSEEDKEKPKKKKDEIKKIFAELSKPRINPEEVSGEVINNLKYIAFLTYYMISPLIIVEDPTLESTFKLYPDIETSFRTRFLNLSFAQRYEFIKSVLNGRSFKQVNEAIEQGKPIFPSESGSERGIDVVLSNFEVFDLNSVNEIKYNLMYYIQPNKDFSRDVMIANVVSEIKRRTNDNPEEIRKQVEEMVGVASDKQSILERVHTIQLKNIKDFLDKKYASLSSQSDEEMRNIQAHYEEVRPALTFKEMEFQGDLPQAELLYTLSGSSEYRSDLQNIAKVMKNTTYEVEVFKIKKEIESKFSDLKKSDRKKAETKYIKKEMEKGELSQVAGNALLKFVEYYDTVSSLPSGKFEKDRMLNFRRIDDLPERLRPSAEKEIRTRLAQILTSHNSHLIEQKDALSKIQVEVNASIIDIIAVADKINNLQTSEEVKNKLLTKIQKEGKINVFSTFKQLSNTMRLNPLVYTGINRSKRVRKTVEEMSELQKIEAAFPKANHSINYCFTQLYLKPWLNLPKSFKYFITHPMDIEKEYMSDKERFLYGKKINKTIPGHDNLYVPTTIFWRVYCSEFLLYKNNKYTCNEDKIQSDLIDPKTRQYILGVYNNQTNDEFRVLTEEDYQKECDWFNNNDMGSLVNFDNVSGIDLNKNIKLARIARDNMKTKIKGVLALIYNAHNANIKTENKLELDAKKLENELYEHSTVQGKTIFYKYIYEVNNFLYLIDPSSPLYPFTGFFQRLLLTTSKSNYANLVKMSIGEVFPEIYLIDDKESFINIVNSKIKELTIQSIKNIRISAEPGFKFPMEVTKYSNYTEQINNKLASFDHSKFKNLCSNYNDVVDPFFVTQVNKELVCVGREQFYQILRDDISAKITVPAEVIERIQSLIQVDKSDELKRIFTMQYVGDDFASRHFNELNYLKELFDEDVVTNTKALGELIYRNEILQRAIKMVETELDGNLSEQEVELFINHLMAQAHNFFIKNIKNYIDTTEVSGELKERLVNEYKKRYGIYQDERFMNNDRAERLEILKGYINELSNKYGESIDEDTQEIIVDYFHTRHILPLVKGFKDEKRESGNNPLYMPECTVCKKDVKMTSAIRTYLFKDGKKVLAEFCSTKCMQKTKEDEYEIPKDIKQVVLHALVDRIINPISLTYDELIHRTKLIGMSLPEGISFNEAYVSWLANSSFADKVWLTYHHETLDKIAKHYNIAENDVMDLWKKLTSNVDFYSLFHSRLEVLAKPYTKYVNQVSMELYSDDCKYSKVEVEDWLDSLAKNLVSSDVYKIDFNSMIFTPFFKHFEACNEIIKSVEERKVAKINRKFLTNIVMFVGGYLPDKENLENLKAKILNMAETMKLPNNVLEHSYDVLYEKLRIKESGKTLAADITKRMNDKYGDDTPLTILATEYNLPINDSNVSVELYRDLLLKIGLDFINKYMNAMSGEVLEVMETNKKVKQVVELSDEKLRKYKKKIRKLESLENPTKDDLVKLKKYRKLLGLSIKNPRKIAGEAGTIIRVEEELMRLKEESGKYSNMVLSLNKSIKDKQDEIETSIENVSGGRWAPEVLEGELQELQNELSYVKDKQGDIEDEIAEVENKLKGYSKGGKVAKKGVGVFRKQKQQEEGKEETDIERNIRIEKLLKERLFQSIVRRLPQNMNVYNIAEILGFVENTGIYSSDKLTLTGKMLKEQKQAKVEEEVSFEEELEKEFGGEEPEGVDKENLEEFAEDDDVGDDEDLGGDDYGEAGEEEYSY
jgi:hypothetical protein